eukprot:3772938-Prymnesium_polylepis.1
MQFDGKDNYHQVSEWHGKTAPTEEDRLQAVRVVQAAVRSTREELLAKAQRSEWCAPQFNLEYSLDR